MKYINYAKTFGAEDKVISWLERNLSKHFEKNPEVQTEIEHIIDYLVSDKCPVRIQQMTYEEARSNTDKWNKALQKKGNNIKETSKDIEIIKEWKKEGFRFVKLVGENAYKREGFLMRNCVASYFGKNTEIYSLRDKNNMPHCTMERGKQVKGKGNGKIHPLYVKYIVAFLEEIGMTVGDNEMKNLGYVNVEKALKEEKDLKFPELYQNKYFYKENLEKVENKDRLSLWRLFGLFGFNSKIEVKFNFDIEKSVSYFRKKLSKLEGKKKKEEDSNEVAMRNSNKVVMEDYNKVVMEDYNEVAMEDSNEVAMKYSNEVAMRNSNKVVMEDYNEVAMKDYNEVAMKDSNEVAMRDYNEVAMRNSNKVVMEDYNEVAMEDSNEVAMKYSNEVAMRNSNKVVMEDYNEVAMKDYNEVAMKDSNEVAMRDYNEVAMKDYNEVAMKDSNEVDVGKVCMLVGNSKNKISMKEKTIAVMGNGSAVKGKIGSWIVLYERAMNSNITAVKTVKIDGKKIKEDTWYMLKKGKIVEV